MAFVFRSERNYNDKKITVGPGEYDEELTKTQGRMLHKNNIKYSTIIKNPKLRSEIPFNSTSKRSKLFEGDNVPGPGSYTINDNSEYYKTNFNHTVSNIDKDLQIFQQEGILPMNKSTNKGFLSSEIRFNKSSSNNEILPGPGSYEIKSIFSNTLTNTNTNNNKIKKEKYIETKGRIYKLPGSQDHIVTTIPDKTKGDFEMVNGYLSEIKKPRISGDPVGPGKYNLYSTWETNGLIWDKGYKKQNRNKINENDIKKELAKNSSSFNTGNYSEKMHNYNMSTASTIFPFGQKSGYMSTMLSTTGYNNTTNNINNNSGICINNMTNYNNNSQRNIEKEKHARNMIFHNFIKSREDLHSKTLSKLKDASNLVVDLEYKEFPGPGFYDQNVIKRHIDYNYTTQNFGSNSPKFLSIKYMNEDLGPGSYFKEKNKYEPKFETVLHAKCPEKQKRKKNNSVFVRNLIKHNVERQPGPGEYDLEGQLIRKEISKINSFGSNVERFKRSKSTDKDNIYLNQQPIMSSNIKDYTHQQQQPKVNKNENAKLKEMELAKQKEKNKRKLYIDKKSPPVGSYSPEITSSISYQVLSKLNPYRNKIAPFNIINSRFPQGKNKQKELILSPGPADYNVTSAFNALNINKKKYNVFGQNKQREHNTKNNFVPGPGLYNLDNPDIWNKRTYNVLFINNH